MRIHHRADQRQVVRAGAAKGGAALQLCRVEVCDVQRFAQCGRDLPQHAEVVGMLVRAQVKIVTLEIEAGAQGVLIAARRGDVALGAQHGLHASAGGGGGQAGDLAADALELEVRGGGEVADLAGGAQDGDRGGGQQTAVLAGLPLAVDALQVERLKAGQHADVRVAGQLSAQRRRVHPAGFGVPQATVFQRQTGQLRGFAGVHRTQQVGGEGTGQARLALGFLGIEGQLQHATGAPVGTGRQALELAPGVAETAHHQLRQRGAVGR